MKLTILFLSSRGRPPSSGDKRSTVGCSSVGMVTVLTCTIRVRHQILHDCASPVQACNLESLCLKSSLELRTFGFVHLWHQSLI